MEFLHFEFAGGISRVGSGIEAGAFALAAHFYVFSHRVMLAGLTRGRGSKPEGTRRIALVDPRRLSRGGVDRNQSMPTTQATRPSRPSRGGVDRNITGE